jgi:hypothetical protein
MSFTEVQGKLSDLFGGAAAANAETFAGRLQILKVTFDEAKESVGAKLLPIIQKLVEFIVNEVVPALGKFAQFFKPITDAIADNKEEFAVFIAFIQKYVVPVLVDVLGGAFKVVGQIAGGIINVIGAVIGGLNSLIAGAVAGINALIRVYNSIPFLPNVGFISAPSINVPSVTVPSVGATTVIPKIVVPTVAGAATGISSAANAAKAVSEAPIGLQTGSAQAKGLSDQQVGGGGTTINLTVTGAFEPEGTARTIINTLNDSFYRGTGGGGNLVMT